jgi:SOS response regulatory protein OraA/RecX
MTFVAAGITSLHSHALSLLAARPQSRAELLAKLVRVCARRRRRAGVVDAAAADAPCIELAEAAVRKLEATSASLPPADALVDDAAFAAFWAAQRARHRPRSRLVLSGELRAKGVAAAVADGALAGHDEGAAALDAARRGRAGGREGRSLTDYLARKGFRFRDAQRAIHLSGGGARGGAAHDDAGAGAVALR